jgi:hypothetical protein
MVVLIAHDLRQSFVLFQQKVDMILRVRQVMRIELLALALVRTVATHGTCDLYLGTAAGVGGQRGSLDLFLPTRRAFYRSTFTSLNVLRGVAESDLFVAVLAIDGAK